MLTFIIDNNAVKTILNAFSVKFSKQDMIAISYENGRIIFEHYNVVIGQEFIYNKISGLNETFSDPDLLGFKAIFEYSDFITRLKIYKKAEFLKFTVNDKFTIIENCDKGTTAIPIVNKIYKTDFNYNIINSTTYNREFKNTNHFCQAKIEILKLLNVLEKTVNIIPEDNYRRAITGLNIHIKSDSSLNSGKITVNATDAHRAIITDLFYEDITFIGSTDQDFIIPKIAVNGIIKLLKNFKKSDSLADLRFYRDHIDLYLNDNKISFYADLIMDNFPDIKKIIPQETNLNNDDLLFDIQPACLEYLESFIKYAGKHDRIIFENDPECQEIFNITHYETKRYFNIPVRIIKNGKWEHKNLKTAFQAGYLLECFKHAKNNILRVLWQGNLLKITNKADNTVSVISRIVL